MNSGTVVDIPGRDSRWVSTCSLPMSIVLRLSGASLALFLRLRQGENQMSWGRRFWTTSNFSSKRAPDGLNMSKLSKPLVSCGSENESFCVVSYMS